MNGMYVDIEANLRTVRNDSGLLTSLDAFEYEGEATDNVSFSLTLEPGIYSVIVEVIVLHPNAKGIAFTMEELQILDDVCEIGRSNDNSLIYYTPTTKWTGVYWNCHGCRSVIASVRLSVDTILSGAFLLQFCMYCSESYT